MLSIPTTQKGHPMILRRIALATTLIPLLILLLSVNHIAHIMQLVIVRDTVNAGGVGAIVATNFADDTANSIRGTLDEVFGNHTAVDCAKGIPGAKSCIVAIGEGALLSATIMNDTIAIGRCSGASLTTESHDLLIGAYTSAPKGKDGFVNIGNKLCFWRDSGATATCPPPEAECVTPTPTTKGN
jgi:hypothetical protein